MLGRDSTFLLTGAFRSGARALSLSLPPKAVCRELIPWRGCAFIGENSLRTVDLAPVLRLPATRSPDFQAKDDESHLDVEWGHLGFKAIKRRNDVHLSPFQQLMRKDSPQQISDLRLARHRPIAIARMQEILDTCERGICLRPEDRKLRGLQKRLDNSAGFRCSSADDLHFARRSYSLFGTTFDVCARTCPPASVPRLVFVLWTVHNGWKA